MKTFKKFIALSFFVSLTVLSSCSECDNENPRARVSNMGTDDVSVQIKTSGGNTENINNILREFYKRLAIPFYIPVIVLVSMLLILTSKEKKFYNRKILLTFLLGLTILILSETSQRFIDNNFYKSFEQSHSYDEH